MGQPWLNQPYGLASCNQASTQSPTADADQQGKGPFGEQAALTAYGPIQPPPLGLGLGTAGLRRDGVPSEPGPKAERFQLSHWATASPSDLKTMETALAQASSLRPQPTNPCEPLMEPHSHPHPRA